VVGRRRIRGGEREFVCVMLALTVNRLSSGPTFLTPHPNISLFAFFFGGSVSLTDGFNFN
jgi:hypothetical protein